MKLSAGLDDLAKSVAMSAAELEGRGEQIVSETVEDIRETARAMAPVDTGELRDSIGGDVAGLTGYVIATADHAAYLEHGTSRQPAQPYMRPAMDRAEPSFSQKAADLLADLLGG